MTVEIPWSLRMLQRLDFPKKLGVCERLYAGQLAKSGVGWVQTAAGVRWKLDLGNATHRWIVYGKYEGAAFLDWAKSFLPPDGVVVDSGANIGQMLLYLAQWVPRGRVLAIEPGSHQADWLEECLAANSVLPVEVIRVALGAAARSARLRDTGAPDRHGSWNQVSDIDGEPIQVVPVVRLLQQRMISRVDLWKLDVEGFEIPALQGAVEWLRDHRIGAVYAELDGDNGRAIISYLAECRYALHIFDQWGRLRRAHEMNRAHTYGLFLPIPSEG